MIVGANGTLQHPPLMHEYPRYFYNANWVRFPFVFGLLGASVAMLFTTSSPLGVIIDRLYSRCCRKKKSQIRRWERALSQYKNEQGIMDQCRKLSAARADSPTETTPGANPLKAKPWLQSRKLAKRLGLAGASLPFVLGNPLASRKPKTRSESKVPFLSVLKRLPFVAINWSNPGVIAVLQVVLLVLMAVFQFAYLTEPLSQKSTTCVEEYDCFVYTTTYLKEGQMIFDVESPPVANCSATHYVLELPTVFASDPFSNDQDDDEVDTVETLQCFQSLELSVAMILANLGAVGASIAALYKSGSVIFDSLVSAKQTAAAQKVAAAKKKTEDDLKKKEEAQRVVAAQEKEEADEDEVLNRSEGHEEESDKTSTPWNVRLNPGGQFVLFEGANEWDSSEGGDLWSNTRKLTRKLGYDDAYELGQLEERLEEMSDKFEARRRQFISSLLFAKTSPQIII